MSFWPDEPWKLASFVVLTFICSFPRRIEMWSDFLTYPGSRTRIKCRVPRKACPTAAMLPLQGSPTLASDHSPPKEVERITIKNKVAKKENNKDA